MDYQGNTALNPDPEPTRYDVWVVEPDNTVEQRPIGALPIDQDTAVATKGLDAGETVVVDGQSRLDVGTHVAIRSPKATEQPAGKS